MREIFLEHNLDDIELEDVLEKALRGARADRERPREFSEPFLAAQYELGAGALDSLFEGMMRKIERALR